MSHAGETFFTVIGCMDGRVQDVVAKAARKHFDAEYPDTITEAGIVGLLAKDSVDPQLLESIKNKLLISIEKHHSKGIIVDGHAECAGNPVEDLQHIEDIKKSVLKVESLIEHKVPVVGVFVKRSTPDSSAWEVETV